MYRSRPARLLGAGLGAAGGQRRCHERARAHGVLTADLSDSMRKAVGFRDVLVHEYVEVSDEIVQSRLGDLRDLERFVEQVTAFLRNGPAVIGHRI
nr:HepT-like ribonuclease domain-containing protein [Mycobacterium helveticum]